MLWAVWAACASEPRPVVAVVVAARDLYPGLPIAADDLADALMPFDQVPQGVFLTREHVVQRVPTMRVLADEFVRTEALADVSRPGLSNQIPVGWRAVAVPFGGARDASPGREVDAWWAPDGGDPCAVVLGAPVVEGEAPGVLRLLVTAADAAPLTVAARSASFRLVLRGAPGPPTARSEARCAR